MYQIYSPFSIIKDYFLNLNLFQGRLWRRNRRSHADIAGSICTYLIFIATLLIFCLMLWEMLTGLNQSVVTLSYRDPEQVAVQLSNQKLNLNDHQYYLAVSLLNLAGLPVDSRYYTVQFALVQKTFKRDADGTLKSVTNKTSFGNINCLEWIQRETIHGIDRATLEKLTCPQQTQWENANLTISGSDQTKIHFVEVTVQQCQNIDRNDCPSTIEIDEQMKEGVQLAVGYRNSLDAKQLSGENPYMAYAGIKIEPLMFGQTLRQNMYYKSLRTIDFQSYLVITGRNTTYYGLELAQIETNYAPIANSTLSVTRIFMSDVAELTIKSNNSIFGVFGATVGFFFLLYMLGRLCCHPIVTLQQKHDLLNLWYQPTQDEDRHPILNQQKKMVIYPSDDVLLKVDNQLTGQSIQINPSKKESIVSCIEFAEEQVTVEAYHRLQQEIAQLKQILMTPDQITLLQCMNSPETQKNRKGSKRQQTEQIYQAYLLLKDDPDPLSQRIIQLMRQGIRDNLDQVPNESPRVTIPPSSNPVHNEEQPLY